MEDSETGRIKRLDQAVVHKIAAGEIIVSPTNALKELLENSLDSGATSIEVVIKDGGFKLLQVTDNGSGIRDDDLEILCERFTTSKIKRFTDLATVTTLGFRGEALASISHIAHLSVVTKTQAATVAQKADYRDGKLLSKKPQAGLQGTQIIVEDLFYNTPSRTQALRNKKKEEYQRILDVVTRYAILYPATFSCKQYGDTQPFVISGSSPKDRIRKVFGSAVANDLLEVKVPSNPSLGLEGVSGFITGVNYESLKQHSYIFFVNNRLVSSRTLQKALQKMFALHTPKGNGFAFLSLSVAAPNVDVNIHPTKQEVKFLYETEIAEFVIECIEETLLATESESRRYKTQSYLSSTALPGNEERPSTALAFTSTSSLAQRASSAPYSASRGFSQPRYEYKLVRTDPTQSTLTSMARPSRGSSTSASATTKAPKSSELVEPDADTEVGAAETAETAETADASEPPVDPDQPVKEYKPYKLASISELKQDVKDQLDVKLGTLFAQHTFVGVVDPEKSLAALQYSTNLYLVDYKEVATQLFYQIGLADFGNFGTIEFTQLIDIGSLLEMADVRPEPDILQPLEDMAAMLEDYFNIVIRNTDSGLVLKQMPLLLQHYSPSVARLPEFFADMTRIDWSNEKECLGGILSALATFYAPVSSTEDEIHLLFENFKRRLIVTTSLIPAVVQIASSHGLYKVFERC